MSEGFEFNGIERNLVKKYSMLRLPINVGFELTPYCNFNCKMCYIHDSKLNCSILRKKHWINFAKQAKDLGVLFILLTGGEPLLHPDFKEIYRELKSMGMVLTLNTNASLIDEEMADFFREDLPRRLNISLYGTTNEIYEKVCGIKNGFDKVDKAIQLLKERNVPVKINILATKLNYDNLDEMYEYCKKNDLTVEANSYLFEPIRKNKSESQQYRLKPFEMAIANIKWDEYRFTEEVMRIRCNDAYETLKNYKVPITNETVNLQCRAGTSSFWVCWNGNAIPCVNIPIAQISLLENSMEDAWNHILQKTYEIRVSKKCNECLLKRFCQTCGAIAYHENGKFDEVPNIICETTLEQVKILASKAEKKGK